MSGVLYYVQVNVRRAGRAATEDTEGPRMSMAMRRQLGMAPNKSPSKAGTPPPLVLSCTRTCCSILKLTHTMDRMPGSYLSSDVIRRSLASLAF